MTREQGCRTPKDMTAGGAVEICWGIWVETPGPASVNDGVDKPTLRNKAVHSGGEHYTNENKVVNIERGTRQQGRHKNGKT
jgi:hypothetical protein